MKQLLSELFHLFTDFIMHLPLALIRNLYAKLILKSFGNGSSIARHVHLVSPWNISIGKNVVINRNVTLDGRSGLIIDDNTDVGEYVSIWTLQHDIDDPHHSTKGDSTYIGDHCWLAPHTIVLPGVRVARGTVAATSSVITKSTNENVLVAGIPAKEIKARKNDLRYILDYKVYL